MTILDDHNDPRFTDRLQSALNKVDDEPHYVDIAVGYLHLSGSTQVPGQRQRRRLPSNGSVSFTIAATYPEFRPHSRPDDRRRRFNHWPAPPRHFQPHGAGGTHNGHRQIDDGWP